MCARKTCHCDGTDGGSSLDPCCEHCLGDRSRHCRVTARPLSLFSAGTATGAHSELPLAIDESRNENALTLYPSGARWINEACEACECRVRTDYELIHNSFTILQLVPPTVRRTSTHNVYSFKVYE